MCCPSSLKVGDRVKVKRFQGVLSIVTIFTGEMGVIRDIQYAGNGDLFIFVKLDNFPESRTLLVLPPGDIIIPSS